MSSGMNESAFFFMYQILIDSVMVKIPFSDFQCSILQFLNIAPSQLHPNGWAFVKAFEILCIHLGIKPITRLFFYFFRAQHKGAIGWVSLAAQYRRKMIAAFTTSCKGFKNYFFKVSSRGEDYPFFLDSAGVAKFPLYWTSCPNLIKRFEYDQLSSREKLEVAYLKRITSIDSQGLIILENNSSGLDAFVGEIFIVCLFILSNYLFY